MTPRPKIPATIVTGFLGAGKTTLLRHLLANAAGRRLALIINEFGDVGIDGSLLAACGDEACRADDIVELANGCLCCTVADEFLPAMEALLGRARPPDHILIETSGLALPKPLVKAFDWPEVRSRVTVDGVIAVVDAEAVAFDRFDPAPQRPGDHDNPLEEVFSDQLATADLVLLNKTDLLAAPRLAAVEAHLRGKLRPGVKLLATTRGEADSRILLGLAAGAEDDLDGRPPRHDGGEAHDHDDFESFAVELGPIADPAAFVAGLRPLLETHGILRLKGFLAVPGKAVRHVVQAVGARVSAYYDRPWSEGEARTSQVVVIGLKGLDRAAIAKSLTG